MFFYIKAKRKVRGSKGFTLMELIIIIAIMGILSAMVVPLSGSLMEKKRVSLTYDKLEMVKLAIVGTYDAYDEEGRPIAGGYVGDVGSLPPLYMPRWNDTSEKWDWPVWYEGDATHEAGCYWKNEAGSVNLEDKAQVQNGFGQPHILWEKDASVSSWNGPYLSYPHDLYPNDTKNFTSTQLTFRKRQTEDQLSDAWGHMLYFWLSDDTDGAKLLIVSGGKDGLTQLDEQPLSPVYDASHANNLDNLIVEISYREWYTAGDDRKIEETKAILNEIQEAILGVENEEVFGYVGDMGKWPMLYYWDEAATDPAWTSVDAPTLNEDNEVDDPMDDLDDDVLLSPRGIWESVDTVDAGFAWRGAYYTTPWGKDSEQVLRDAWGNALDFRLKMDTDGNTIFYIYSAGADGKIIHISESETDEELIAAGEAANSDNLSIMIYDYEWKNGGVHKNTSDKLERTKEMLSGLRRALIGPENAFDETGRRIVGGYLADMGAWPELEDGELTALACLWEEQVSDFYEWKGPYYTKPWEDTLTDAWGTALELALIEDKTLTITSAGPDCAMDESDAEATVNDDNLTMIISKEDWYCESLTLKFKIVNNTPSVGNEAITMKLYKKSNTAYKEISFPIDMSQEVQYINLEILSGAVCGQQTLGIAIDIGDESKMGVYIGKGGSQSPNPIIITLP